MRSLFLLLLPLLAVAACSSGGSDVVPVEPIGERPSAPPDTQGESEQSKEKPKDPTTTLSVGIAAEERVLAYFDHADVVAKVNGAIAVSKGFKREDGKKMFPYELVLAAPTEAPEAQVEITISGYTSPAATEAIVTRILTTRFVAGKAKLAYVLLEERCLTMGSMGGMGPSGPTCDAALTCIGGKCRAPAVEPAMLLDYYADWATKPPSRCGTGSDATIEPGTGIDTFTAMTTGMTVTLEQGPQCGVHFWVAVRMKNFQQQGTTTTLSAKQPGSGITIPPTAYPYTYTEDNGACEVSGLRFQLDMGGAKKTDLVGKPLDVTIEATDKLGHTASVTRQVNVSPTVTGNYPYCNN